MTAKGQRKANGDLEFAETPSYLIRRCQQLYGDLYARETGARDLTKQQFTVLCALEHHEGASQTALVEMTGIDRSTLAEMVRRMLEKGLISRERTEEDQRANAVAITPAGRKALRTARTAADRAEKALAGRPARRRAHALPEVAGRHRRRRRGMAERRHCGPAQARRPPAQLSRNHTRISSCDPGARPVGAWRCAHRRAGLPPVAACSSKLAGALRIGSGRLAASAMRRRSVPARRGIGARLLAARRRLAALICIAASFADYGFQSLKISRARALAIAGRMSLAITPGVSGPAWRNRTMPLPSITKVSGTP